MKYLLLTLTLIVSISNTSLLAANFDGVTPNTSTNTTPNTKSASTSKSATHKTKASHRRHIHHTDAANSGRNRLNFDETWLGWVIFFAIPSSLIAAGILAAIPWLWILGGALLLYCAVLFFWLIINFHKNRKPASSTSYHHKKRRHATAQAVAYAPDNTTRTNRKGRFWSWVALFVLIPGVLVAIGLIFNILWLTILGTAIGLTLGLTFFFLILALITSWTGIK